MELKSVSTSALGIRYLFKLYLYGIEIILKILLQNPKNKFKLYLYGIEMDFLKENFVNALKFKLYLYGIEIITIDIEKAKS